ncbi:MAG: diguanylate cyclase [Proteobacteria bacterium]|nr:diguanylate cyclase [Pseudomonadota bacterium]
MASSIALETSPRLKPRPGFPVAEALLGLALFGAAWVSIFLTRVPGGIALFWPGSAIAGAVLIRLTRVRWIAAAVFTFSPLALASIVAAHRPWPVAFAFSAVNLLEIALMVLAFRFVWRRPYPNITIEHAALMTALFGIWIPALASCLGGWLLHLLFALPWITGMQQFWSSHTIGACLLGPPIILFSVKGLRRLARPVFLIENLFALLIAVGGCYLAIRHVRFPFVAISLMLIVIAFRVGGFGASLMSLAIGLMITNLWIAGIRPFGFEPTTATEGTLLGLPVIAFLATVMPPVAVGLGSDARRAAARDLRVSERRFRESMAHSPIGMLIAEISGRWTYTNLALQKMLGYSEAELRDMPPGGPSRNDDWKEGKARMDRLLSGEIDNYDIARCFRHKDGRWIWTHVAVSLTRDDDGSPLHVIAQIESLEARQLAEQKLAAERERLTTTLGAISDAVITTDADTRINYINPAAQSLLGLELEAVANRKVYEVIHLVDPRTSKAAANLISQGVLHGKVLRRELPCQLHRPDGTVCWVSDVVSPVVDSTGGVSGMVIVFRDASDEVVRSRDLQHRAMHDSLTGLSNRIEFHERLRETFLKSHHLNRPAAVIAIDLDRFKAVNDTGGHAAGDAILRKVADACRGAVRNTDTVARLGGDEFAVILDNCGAPNAKQIARQLLQVLNPLATEWEGQTYSVNASLGLALISAQMSDAQAWLDDADKACYQAKKSGRGQLMFA